MGKFNRRIVKNMLMASVLFLIPVFFIEDKVNYTKGLIGGVLYSVLAYNMIVKMAQKSLELSPNKARVLVGSGYLMRYILVGLILVSAVMYSKTMFVGTVLGIMTMKLAMYMEMFNKTEN